MSNFDGNFRPKYPDSSIFFLIVLRRFEPLAFKKIDIGGILRDIFFRVKTAISRGFVKRNPLGDL